MTSSILSRSHSLDYSTSGAWVRMGLQVMACLLVVMFGFGLFVSINGAVVSSGQVTVKNSYKTVQHLDGGIVAKILVRNGDQVEAGEPLVMLDKTADQAELTVLTERYAELLIEQARLEAERDGRNTVQIPAGLSKSEAITKTLATQRALFKARMQTYRGEMAMLSGRIEQSSAQISGLVSQKRARARERDLMQKDLAGIRQLFQKGYANQQRLTQMERDAARLDGEVGRLTSEIARARGALDEAKLALTQRRKTFIEGVIDELKKVQTALNELNERRKALKAKVARGVIRAPRSGRIHALAIHTEGGVIEPAKPILQIVPQNERMIVEARVAPAQIDKVHTGQTAQLVFPAFNQRVTPRLSGRVAQVSAAELSSQDGQSYFTAEIEIAKTELDKIGSGQSLKPGMPAEVFITTEARSILSYFLKPLTDAMFRAFREA